MGMLPVNQYGISGSGSGVSNQLGHPSGCSCCCPSNGLSGSQNPLGQDSFMMNDPMALAAQPQQQDNMGGLSNIMSSSTMMLLTTLNAMMAMVSAMVSMTMMMLQNGSLGSESASSSLGDMANSFSSSQLNESSGSGSTSHEGHDHSTHNHDHSAGETEATAPTSAEIDSNVRPGDLTLPIDAKYFDEPGRDFGNHLHPIHGEHRHHNGADFGAPSGTPLYAVADGVISHKPNNGGAGNTADLVLEDGTKFRYFHLKNFEGEERTVKKGEIIGYVGSTGASTGPHLHFEYHPPGTSGAPVWPVFKDLV